LGCANEDKVIYRLLHHCQFLVGDERRPDFSQGYNAIDAFRNFIAVRNGVQYPSFRLAGKEVPGLTGFRLPLAQNVGCSLIAFRSHRSGDAEIYVMNADGSGLAPIASCAEGGHFPDWYQPLATTGDSQIGPAVFSADCRRQT
jgi:hypothetical protein